MMLGSNMPYEEYSESMFRFSHLLIRDLIKGLSPNKAIQYFFWRNALLNCAK